MFLNLTGTLPKGLLSPTNNSCKKHKHADYFKNANSIAFSKFDKTTPINFNDNAFSINMRNENN
jgi:hypothetical protein